MCGIVGALFRNAGQAVSLTSAMQRLHHRGPDNRGVWNDAHICLGHTRLSILDLSPLAHQPMSDRAGRFWITFNGEIYNYLELRQELSQRGHTFTSQSDTEVLLAAYAEWGTASLHKLRGMFAFAVWDRDREILFLARDRVGEKPLYYWQDCDRLYFASELKALLALLPHRPPLDPVAVDLYLHYQYVPEPRTPLVGIHKLPAAHYLVIQPDDCHIQPKRYWGLEQIQPVEGDPVEQIRVELEQVIRLTLRSDVPVGVALSGGIDSGAIAALAAAQSNDTVQAFSVGYPGRPTYDERSQAQDLATKLGLPFFDIELHTGDFVDFFPDLVAAVDDPIADIAAYGHYAVMRLAREHGVKVMLSGIGGDELFWGYSWVAEAVRLTEHKRQFLQNSDWPTWMWEGLAHLTDHSIYQRLARSRKVPKAVGSVLNRGLEVVQLTPQHPQQAVYQDLAPDFKEALRYRSKLYPSDIAAQIPDRNPYRPFELDLNRCSADIPSQISQILFNTWLMSNCLSLGDRVSMMASVETRLPFLDYCLIELVFGLRKTQPDRELGHKFWLKAALKGILPDEVLDRPKQGFQPPTQEWMQGVIAQYVAELKQGYLMNTSLINRSFLSQMIQQFQDSRQHTFMLFKLLLLELWYQKVVLKET